LALVSRILQKKIDELIENIICFQTREKQFLPLHDYMLVYQKQYKYLVETKTNTGAY